MKTLKYMLLVAIAGPVLGVATVVPTASQAQDNTKKFPVKIDARIPEPLLIRLTASFDAAAKAVRVEGGVKTSGFVVGAHDADMAIYHWKEDRYAPRWEAVRTISGSLKPQQEVPVHWDERDLKYTRFKLEVRAPSITKEVKSVVYELQPVPVGPAPQRKIFRPGDVAREKIPTVASSMQIVSTRAWQRDSLFKYRVEIVVRNNPGTKFDTLKAAWTLYSERGEKHEIRYEGHDSEYTVKPGEERTIALDVEDRNPPYVMRFRLVMDTYGVTDHQVRVIEREKTTQRPH